MCVFHISNLEIQTTVPLPRSFSSRVTSYHYSINRKKNTGSPVITLVGIKDPEPLRALIMDLAQGQPSVVAVTGTESTASSYHTNSGMAALGEGFKPSLQYRPYLAIITIGLIVFVWLLLSFPLILFCIAAERSSLLYSSILSVLLVLLFVTLAFSLLWVVLYSKSIIYHLNKTEITCKRGVFLKRRSIVPYNKITNVDIVQGSLMRLFHISDLEIRTIDSSADVSPEVSDYLHRFLLNSPLRFLLSPLTGPFRAIYLATNSLCFRGFLPGDSPTITLVGIKEPEHLHALIMGLVRS